MAIDIIARGLATSLIGPDGKISSEKMPTLSTIPTGAQFYPVGALTDPSALEGKTTEAILLMMLFGIVNPILVAPTLGAEADSPTAIAGHVTTISGTLTFNRGSITPAYGTSGYRAGAPLQYTVNDNPFIAESAQQPFTISFTPTLGVNEIMCSVEYAAGEQPMNSIGNSYDAPLPAGALSTILVIQGISPIYTQDGEPLEFEYFKDTEGEGYQSTVISEGSGQKQSFMLSQNTTVLGVKQWNVVTEQWEWIGGSPEASLLTFDTALIQGASLGETEDFIAYTHNGSATGERQLRIYVAN